VTLLWYSDPRFAGHDAGKGHPERPSRVEAVEAGRRLVDPDAIDDRQPEPADRTALTRVHTPAHIDLVESVAAAGGGRLDRDTAMGAASPEAARLAAGAGLSAINALDAGAGQAAFCAVRPPGHHATPTAPMGFCLFNNVAVAARALQTQCGLEKLLILDWDVHHGNGTQHIFEDSKKVLFFSTHQFPYYPGTGSIDEKGVDQGQGYTVNIPLSTGMGDAEYIKIFQEILIPIAAQYKPEFILVSAGFDSFIDDAMGGMNVTAEGFARLTEIIINLSQQLCDGKLIFVLEGGYNLNGLWECTNKVFETLLNYNKTDLNNLTESTKADSIIDEIKKSYSQFWKF